MSGTNQTSPWDKRDMSPEQIDTVARTNGHSQLICKGNCPVCPVCQRSPNLPEFAQPRLSRSNGNHPQREGTNSGVFVPIWLVLPKCEATNLICALVILPYSNGAVQIRVCLELTEFVPDGVSLLLGQSSREGRQKMFICVLCVFIVSFESG